MITVPAKRVCRFRGNSRFFCLRLTGKVFFFQTIGGIPFLHEKTWNKY